MVLTDEQRRRIELNRQRALEKSRQRLSTQHVASRFGGKKNSNNYGGQTGGCGESSSGLATSLPTTNHSAADADVGDKSSAPARESFGDSNIDWSAAVDDMERIVASASLASKMTISNNTSKAPSQQTNANKRKKLDNNCPHHYFSATSQPTDRADAMGGLSNINSTQLTDEQRVRIEENRQKALAKKQMKSTSAPSDNGLEPSASTVLTEQQQLRMEANKRRALEKKEQKERAAATPCTITHTKTKQAATSDGYESSASAVLTEEQRSRIEENRRKALEKKQKALSQSVTASDTQQVIVSKKQESVLTEEQRAMIEEKRRTALEKKQAAQKVSVDSIGSLNEQCNRQSSAVEAATVLSSLTDEQKTKIEEKRLLALQKKQSAQALTDTEAPTAAEGTKAPAKEPTETELPQLPPDLHYDESRCLPVDDEHTDTLIENAKLDKPLLNGWTLYGHQQEGVLRSLRMRRLVLAFDMGLGKMQCLIESIACFFFAARGDVLTTSFHAKGKRSLDVYGQRHSSRPLRD